MTNFTQRSEYEARTHELFANYFQNEFNWTSERAVIANVFKAMWSDSLSLERINALACAICNLKEFDASATLTKLVRAKVLRSRMICGVRHWEVNC